MNRLRSPSEPILLVSQILCVRKRTPYLEKAQWGIETSTKNCSFLWPPQCPQYSPKTTQTDTTSSRNNNNNSTNTLVYLAHISTVKKCHCEVFLCRPSKLVFRATVEELTRFSKNNRSSKNIEPIFWSVRLFFCFTQLIPSRNDQ
jgi:hypothetical protein